MRRRRWFRLRLVALGLAVAAFAPTVAAQAMPADADRGEAVVSPHDRPEHGPSDLPTPHRVTSSMEDGFELSSRTIAGIGLAVAAAVAAGYAALQAFKADKATGI